MTFTVDRRKLIGAAGASALAAALPTTAAFATAGSGMLSAVNVLLAGLDPASAEQMRFPFRGLVHGGWEFRGTHPKPGFLIEKMKPAQKQAAYGLLRAGLSKPGYDKMRLIMQTQDVMREMGRGPKNRNSERFAIALFGTPSHEEMWGVRVEGHHLSLSWTLKGDDIVAITPASFSVIPQHIPIGSLKDTVVLEREETLARQLVKDLQGKKRASALIAENPPGDVLAVAGYENRFDRKQGIATADMTSAQRDMLWEIINETTVKPWPKPISTRQSTRIREGDPEAVHFAWAGGIEPGEMYYYRIHGDTFTLELTSVLNDAEHLHAVFHDPERTLGHHLPLQ